MSDVRLELDRVGSGIGNGINEGMGQTQTAIVRLRHLTNHQTGPGIFGFRISDFGFVHWQP